MREPAPIVTHKLACLRIRNRFDGLCWRKENARLWGISANMPYKLNSTRIAIGSDSNSSRINDADSGTAGHACK